MSNYISCDNDIKQSSNISDFSGKPFKVIIIYGGPGSGKGTLCKTFCEKYNQTFSHISIGEILLEFNFDTTTERGKILKEELENYKITGKYPNFETPSYILLDKMKEDPDKIYLIDGFHKNMEIVNYWETIIEEHVDCKMFLELKCSIDILRERLMSRKRKDGSAEVINKRLGVHSNEGPKIVDYYKDRISLNNIFCINTEGSTEEIFSEFEQLVKMKGLI